MTAQEKRSFLHGAGILAAAGVIIKIIGACFRIPLGNLIGDEGMGYYSLAYPIYTILVVIATTGIPIAVSRLVAERMVERDPEGAHRVFRVTLAVMLLVGLAFFAALFFGADLIVLVNNRFQGAIPAIRAIAPALIFVPVMSVFRGYFQGMHDMRPTALSQIIEQLFRVVAGLACAFLLVDFGLEYAAAGGTFGATAGGIAGVVFMIVIYNKRRRRGALKLDGGEGGGAPRPREGTSSILRKLVVIALPITLGASIMPLMWNIDALVVPPRLVGLGYTTKEAVALYGQLTGFAEPLMNLPKVLTQAVAISMVPTIVRAWKEKDEPFLHYNVALGLRFSLLIALPCATGFMVLANPILLLLYPAQPEVAASAAPVLVIYGVGVVFLSSIDALTSALQGVGRQMVPLQNIAIGAACKLVLTIALTGLPAWGVKGAAFGTVCAYAVATVLNYRAVVQYTGTRFDPSLTFVRPILSTLAMGAVCAGVYHLMGAALPGGEGLGIAAALNKDPSVVANAVCTLVAILASAVCYLALLFATKSIEGEELRQLPKGEKLYALCKKLRLIKK